MHKNNTTDLQEPVDNIEGKHTTETIHLELTTVAQEATTYNLEEDIFETTYPKLVTYNLNKNTIETTHPELTTIK